MLYLNFYLKDPTSKEPTLIYLKIIINKSAKKISTRQKIKPANWNKKVQRAKSTAVAATAFNSVLDNIQAQTQALYSKHFIGAESNIDSFFLEVSQYIKGKFEAPNHMLTMMSILNSYGEIRKSALKKSTLKEYAELSRKLEDFAAKRKVKLSFENIDLNFYDNFLDYLIQDQKLKTNSWSGHIKNLKSFMSFSMERGWHKNAEFKKFKREHEKKQFIYFSTEDFEKIRDVDLGKNSNLDKTRRLFCISCMTGLRHSDVININYENIEGNFYKLGIQKKSLVSKIKMSNTAISYIKEYYDLYGVGGGYSNQTSNWHLKKIMIAAELDRLETVIEKDYKGRFINTSKPIYEWLSFHYGRRFFIIKCLEMGMKELEIMEITGHEDYRVFKGYVKFADQNIIDELNRAWK